MNRDAALAFIVAAALIGMAFLWNTSGAEALPSADPLPVTPVVNHGPSRPGVRTGPLIMPAWFYPPVATGAHVERRNQVERVRFTPADAASAPGPTNTPVPLRPVPLNTPAPPVGRTRSVARSSSALRPQSQASELSASSSSARELSPVVNTGDDGPLPQRDLLREAGFRVDLSTRRTPATSRISSQSASDVRCVDVLLNPQLDVVEFGDGSGSIDYWSILFQNVYYDSEPGYYQSPSYSLLLVDELDGSDPDLVDYEGATWDYDAFAQGFTVPPGLTALQISFSDLHADVDSYDRTRSYIWTLTADGYLDQWVAYADIPKDTEWANWYWFLPDTAFSQVAGKPVAVLYEMLSDRMAPGEWMWLDDLQVTVCYQRGPSGSYLPMALREPSTPSGPTCSPREPDSLTSPGSLTVGATCRGSFSPVDERDYYALNLNGARKVRLRLSDLAPNQNWDALIYENTAGYPLVCHLPRQHPQRWINCPSVNGYSDSFDLNKDYFILVNRGPNTTGGTYTLRVERR